MTRRSAILRALTLLLAVVQLATPALSAIADGHLAASGRDAVAHVEATSSTACPAVHPPDCAVCRYLSGTVVVPEGSPEPCLGAPAVAAPVALRAAHVAALVGLPDGRAPPVL